MKNVLLASVAAATLLAGAAQAADLPSRRAAPAPAYVAVPVFTWTGFYVGVNAGYGFGNDNTIATTGNQTTTISNVSLARRAPFLKNEPEGFVGGGGVGYNFQIGSIVMGAEADIQYTDFDKRQGYRSSLNDPSTYRTQMDYLGTVRGRLGYAFDRLLVYATGGLAYGDVRNGANFFSNAAGNPLAFTGFRRSTETGYTVGGGVEYAIPNYTIFNSAVTVKAEYLYYDLGQRNVTINTVTNNGLSYNTRFNNDGHLVRAGLNFKFGTY